MKILITGKPHWYEKDSHGAISYYRIAKPLFELSLKYKNIEIVESAAGTWPEIAKADIVFVHTPMHAPSVESIFTAKQEGKKVWLDFDDMVFADDIPKANIAWTFFNGESSQKNLKAAIAVADAISVSTPQIKERIVSLYNFPEDNIFVIPNAIPDGLWANRAKFNPPKEKELRKVMWRGSVTHEGDLQRFKDGIKPHKGLGYLFVGHLPWVLHTSYGGHLEELSYQPWEKPLPRYWQLLKEVNPHYLFVTLERCDFNRGKSNIAWLEATYAGAACIAQSDMPEFAKVPTVQYKSPKDLDRILAAIGSGKDLLTEKYLESRAVIESQYLLSITNKLRMNLIESL